MKVKTVTVVAGMAAMLSLAAAAHHSNLGFYVMEETSEVTGVVKSWSLTNPHPELIVEVTAENGESTEMRAYALATAGGLQRAGWTPDTLVAGETVTITGHIARRTHSSMGASSVTRADGTTLSLRPSAAR